MQVDTCPSVCLMLLKVRFWNKICVEIEEPRAISDQYASLLADSFRRASFKHQRAFQSSQSASASKTLFNCALAYHFNATTVLSNAARVLLYSLRVAEAEVF